MGLGERTPSLLDAVWGEEIVDKLQQINRRPLVSLESTYTEAAISS